jgi:sterol desaturase/sphingolipid hydroxylase (fatty acid hydroxylase superfamily)
MVMTDPPADGGRGAHLSLRTTEPTSFGHGFISGLASALLGIAALGVALSFRFPGVLAATELQPLYQWRGVRPALVATLVASFLLGGLAAVLRANKTLALIGLGSTLAAGALSVPDMTVTGATSDSWLGLDFFALNLLLYAAVFVPLERLFPLRVDQQVFRASWPIDLTYFFVNSLLIEVLTVLTLKPAVVLFGWARLEGVGAGALPLLIQVPALLLVADFTQYWVHRAFHAWPLLWRFHAIHHSSGEMDWLAGSRLHLVDVALTRGLTYIPIFVLGFSDAALLIYVFLVAAQATFIHANVGWRFRAVRRMVATPAFHHWHHSAEAEAVDRNFAVHTPIWDLAFGTYYLPDRWPDSYGLSGGRTVPGRWLTQFLHPFALDRRHDG